MIGAFYLTDKEGAAASRRADQELIELLAAHAAIAITNARLYERSRELSILEERNRLALELHDAVSQKLFGLVLTAEAAGDAARTATPARRARAARRGAASSAPRRWRSCARSILELRPPDLERDGLAGALRKQVEVLRRLHGRARSRSTSDGAATAGDRRATARSCASRRRRCTTPLRHAGARHVAVRLARRATAAACSRCATTAAASTPPTRAALAPARA